MVEEVMVSDALMIGDSTPQLTIYEDKDVSLTVPPPASVAARHAAVIRNRDSAPLLFAVNFWHLQMLNDDDRYLAYRDALRRAIRPDDIVFEIGGGSSLLAIAAARMNPLHVYTVEVMRHFAEVARRIVAANGVAKRVTVINAMSTHVQPRHLRHGPPTVLFSETIGMTLISEGQLDWVHDARDRLLAPGGRIIPGAGRQYVTLFESQTFDNLTRAHRVDGIDLDGINEMRDSSRLFWSRQFGVPASHLGLEAMSAPITVLDLNFYNFTWDNMPVQRIFRVRVLRDGIIHGAFAHFDLFEDAAAQRRMLTTYPHANQSLPRQVCWGVGLAVLQDERRGGAPLKVRRGDLIEVIVTFNRVHFDIEARPVGGPACTSK